MSIRAIETLRLGEFPNLVWVIVEDSDGVRGLGETFMGADAVETYLHETVAPKLAGCDAAAVGVNPTLMVTLVDKIIALNQRGYTFLIIEHNMDVVMSICNPVMVMAQGKLIYQGDAEGAHNDPQVLDAYLGDLP